jgi:hypothetical protein
MDKIQIMTTCKACRGVTYLAASVTTEDGNIHTTYQPCYACGGSGIQFVWIDLREFARLLNAIAAETPQKTSKHGNTDEMTNANKE